MYELTHKIKEKFQAYDQKQLEGVFIDACQNNHLEVIKYLLTSPELNQHVDIHTDDAEGFRWACFHGHLEVVQYLLTSPELNDHVNINVSNNCAFKWACMNGHVELVKYLLSSPELQEHADVHAENESGFRLACQYGHLEIVEYLLSSPYLNDHADIHALNDHGFERACLNRHEPVIEYLILFDRQYIKFQETSYNLDWAMSKQQHSIVKAMITSLYKNDLIAYLENIHNIEKYCQEHGLHFQNWLENMQNKNSMNSAVPELFM